MKCPTGCQKKAPQAKMQTHAKNCDFIYEFQLITPAGEIQSSQDGYWWSEQKIKLPVEISYEVKCSSYTGEALAMFSEEKRAWCGQSSPIALSWYMSPSRSDYDFRTKIFEAFPESKRHAGPILMEVDRFYHVSCQIYSDKAEFSIDGVKYASCSLKPGDVPSEGHFGMGKYIDNYSIFKDLKVRQLNS